MKIEIRTERLKLLPLMPEQLVLLAADAEKLACALGLSYQGEKIAGRFRDILLEQAEKAKADIQNYLWHSFWLIIRKEDGAVIGMVDFKNVPDEKGNVEIGYGLGRQHGRRGYMTEAVHAMCSWAKRQRAVAHILAQTEPGNLASERVLEKCGFRRYAKGPAAWWIL